MTAPRDNNAPAQVVAHLAGAMSAPPLKRTTPMSIMPRRARILAELDALRADLDAARLDARLVKARTTEIFDLLREATTPAHPDDGVVLTDAEFIAFAALVGDFEDPGTGVSV